jgi:ADP-ribose pyrophosphatase YjhB (NUDIX family)
MQVVYALQPFPEEWSHAIFLAGPTPRAEHPVSSWRPEALRILEENGYDGVVFVPEAEDGVWAENYVDQVEWERKGLHFADHIVFWVPRDLDTMPAFTTNVEFGSWARGDVSRLVYGHPDGAPKTRYLDWMLSDETDGHGIVHHTLEGTIIAAADHRHPPDQRDETLRTAGERYIPMHIWRTQMFQSWYESQKAVGNRLDEAEVKWVFQMPKARKVFAWVLWVKVWIEAEGRWKENEWVFSRTDISTIVMHRIPYQGGQTPDLGELLDTEIVLIREFRSPARTADGFVHELPGGSSLKPNKDPLEVASSELHEETGIIIEPDRFRLVGSRQIASTLSSHHAHVFAVKAEEHEMEGARRIAAANTAHGVEEDSERTYVEVTTVRDLLSGGLVDWAMLGMVFQALPKGNAE